MAETHLRVAPVCMRQVAGPDSAVDYAEFHVIIGDDVTEDELDRETGELVPVRRFRGRVSSRTDTELRPEGGQRQRARTYGVDCSALGIKTAAEVEGLAHRLTERMATRLGLTPVKLEPEADRRWEQREGGGR